MNEASKVAFVILAPSKVLLALSLAFQGNIDKAASTLDWKSLDLDPNAVEDWNKDDWQAVYDELNNYADLALERKAESKRLYDPY